MRPTFSLQRRLGLCCSLWLLACGASPPPRPVAPTELAAERPDPDSEPPEAPILDEPSPDPSEEGEWEASEEPEETRAGAFTPHHPFDDLSAAELKELVRKNPKQLGSLSVGLPNNGRLLNGVPLPGGKFFEPVSPGFAFGTQETIDYLMAAVRKVHEQHPDTPPLHVGHLSSKTGGYLSPHLSHQSGRDVDLGYYYTRDGRWYARATAANLDVERTWTFVRALITETDVEMILIDHSVQRLLKEHALARGEDPDWIDGLFVSRKGKRALIRHVRGHQTHLHVRFFSPLAQVGAQKAYPLLVEHRLIPPVVSYVNHTAKKGDSLIKLARVYGTTVQAIQKANGLKKTLIIAKKTYRIPRTGGPAPVTGKLTFPARRLPPGETARRAALDKARPAGD